MRRLSFATVLTSLNAGLVLVAVIGVTAGAVNTLRRLADRQALARVSLAGASAVQAVGRAEQDVLTSAHLLAERSALSRLLAAGDRPSALVILDRFRRASRLSGCAVLGVGRPLLSGDARIPWSQLLAVQTNRAVAESRDGVLVLGGAAPLPGVGGATVVAALRLDRQFASRLASQIGLEVAIVSKREALERGSPQTELRERALDSAVMSRIDEAALYLAARPLHDPSGAAVGLVECALPTRGVDDPVAQLGRELLGLALAVAALVTLLSAAAIRRWLAHPVQDLTSSAARIGRGDLATPVARAPGAELGVLAATMEETRRQLLRLTAELRRRQAEGESVLSGIAEGVFSVDRDRRICYINGQAAAILGVKPGDAIGRFCGDVLNPRGADGSRPCEDGCPIVHARFRGGARATEYVAGARGVRHTVVITSAAPVEERQFQVLREETGIEAARRQRDLVLANISHEFKTPLAAQRASLELLRERLLEQPGAVGAEGAGIEELVLSLERGELRLSQLIDNLLESVRIESGRDGIRSRPVALDEVVEEAVGLTAPLLAQRAQRVAVELPFPLPSVLGDGPRLTQVFVNLIANANKYAPAGSTLHIGGTVDERLVVLWVEDEGPGLPEGLEVDGKRLFGRFVRSPGNGGEPEQGGMGLGLWIVQSILERHGGTIEALRTGLGTRMRLQLPRAAPADRAAGPDQSARAAPVAPADLPVSADRAAPADRADRPLSAEGKDAAA